MNNLAIWVIVLAIKTLILFFYSFVLILPISNKVIWFLGGNPKMRKKLLSSADIISWGTLRNMNVLMMFVMAFVIPCFALCAIMKTINLYSFLFYFTTMSIIFSLELVGLIVVSYVMTKKRKIITKIEKEIKEKDGEIKDNSYVGSKNLFLGQLISIITLFFLALFVPFYSAYQYWGTTEDGGDSAPKVYRQCGMNVMQTFLTLTESKNIQDNILEICKLRIEDKKKQLAEAELNKNSKDLLDQTNKCKIENYPTFNSIDELANFYGIEKWNNNLELLKSIKEKVDKDCARQTIINGLEELNLSVELKEEIMLKDFKNIKEVENYISQLKKYKNIF